MKKLFLICCVASVVSFACAIDQVLSFEEGVALAKATQEKFGGFEYLEKALLATGGPVIEKFEKVKKVMTDPQYIFTVIEPSESDPYYYVCCYMKAHYDDSAYYTKIGMTMLSKVQDGVYWLDRLHVDYTQRKNGLGTTLFLYTQQVMRQIVGKSDFLTSYCLSLKAEPFGEGRKLDQYSLNSFYRSLSGHQEEDDVFRWRGVPLKPFYLFAKK